MVHWTVKPSLEASLLTLSPLGLWVFLPNEATSAERLHFSFAVHRLLNALCGAFMLHLKLAGSRSATLCWTLL